jgi:hypothetical protein
MRLRALLMATALVATVGPKAVQAQAQRFLWSPGPSVGPETTIEPTNCVMGADGSITCDTRLVNPPSDTKAKAQLDGFYN